MLATHLNIPLNEIYVRPFTDSRSDAFKKVSFSLFFKYSNKEYLEFISQYSYLTIIISYFLKSFH
jgi:hypothetical protein